MDGVRAPALRLAREARDRTTAAREAAEPAGAAGLQSGAEALAANLAPAVRSVLGQLAAELARIEERPHARQGEAPSPRDRPAGVSLWTRLAGRTSAERLWLVEHLPEFQGWPLVVELAERSRGAAADDAAGSKSSPVHQE